MKDKARAKKIAAVIRKFADRVEAGDVDVAEIQSMQGMSEVAVGFGMAAYPSGPLTLSIKYYEASEPIGVTSLHKQPRAKKRPTRARR